MPAQRKSETDTAPFRVIFDSAKSVGTPIQLISFALAVLTTIVLSRVNPGTNLLVFTVLLLPFILLILVFNEKILARFRTASHGLVAVAILVIVGSFSLSGYLAVILVRSSQESLVEPSGSNLLGSGKLAKAQTIRDAQFRLASYLDTYRLVSNYYYSALTRCFQRDDSRRACETVAQLRAELDGIAGKMIGIKRSTLGEIYGGRDITGQVLRLQGSILALGSTRYFWDVVLKIYGSRGETHKLRDIIDTKGWKISQKDREDLDEVDFSDIEADLIRALGRDIVLKPINGFGAADIDAVRAALRSLGYLSEASNGVQSADLYNRYRNSLEDYFTPEEQSTPFYKLAFMGIQQQIPVYLSLYDTGLLDFRKFLLKYSPANARQVLLDLMDTRISLFRLDDMNRLTEAILQQRRNVTDARDRSNIVLFQIREDFQNALSGSADVQDVLAASTVEEYFIRSLKMALRKSGDPAKQGVFVDFSGGVGQGLYPGLLQELLRYYNLFETDLVLGAIGRG